LVVRRIGKMFFFVEKVQRLIAKERDMGMLRERIVERGRAGFLHTGQDEVSTINAPALKKSGQTGTPTPDITIRPRLCR
jgi:rhamnose utilization protein RhaD (predicted bifunctional aldolase and dehydrogenase)